MFDSQYDHYNLPIVTYPHAQRLAMNINNEIFISREITAHLQNVLKNCSCPSMSTLDFHMLYNEAAAIKWNRISLMYVPLTYHYKYAITKEPSGPILKQFIHTTLKKLYNANKDVVDDIIYHIDAEFSVRVDNVNQDVFIFYKNNVVFVIAREWYRCIPENYRIQHNFVDLNLFALRQEFAKFIVNILNR